ncbi:hypothetical protein [Rhodococcoides corynebacterioides]|uniref:Condensation domain-containing protein n=1 Tax=Rhodococcoides corynebacterioides TaxID=53972 RepID=A0ABS7P0E9_9NOCA|nr:hypothetical protein [Rhodococcus corynebacterioides]MBY6365878.1 hypothetical protein [Rhodococcus corynebacterioides]MBY6409273.1 hypothetical protein [Rhodococcus corynebacterioides]
MSRLQDQDFTYWFLREAFGWDVVLQLTWMFDTAPATAAVQDFTDALTASRLHRRVVRPRIPPARPSWVRSTADPVLSARDAPVPADERDAWARALLRTSDLDAEAGRCWAVHLAPDDHGGAVLSLTCLHLAADGRALTTAATDAAAATRMRAPAPSTLSTRPPGPVDDLVDAGLQVGRAARGTARAVRAALTSRTAGTGETSGARPAAMPARPPRSAPAIRAPRAHPSWVVVDTDTDHWAERAARYGGTPNSLFVAVVAGALYASGYAAPGDPVSIGVPVSLRGPDAADDQRSNATGGVTVVVDDRPSAGGDLGPVRARCRAAFTAVGAGDRPAAYHLQSLLQVLPIALVTRVVMAGPSGMPDAVASNLGRFDGLARMGDATATSVSFRGDARGVRPDRPERFGEGVQSWLLETEGRTTFAVAGFDETCVGTVSALRDAVRAELDAWGVRGDVA